MSHAPSSEAAAKVAKYAPTSRHPEGREARTGDIVQGAFELTSGGEPFIGRVTRVLPEAGRVEIALLRRPGSMPGQLPLFRKQNESYQTCETYLASVHELTLRSRSSQRPKTSHAKPAPKSSLETG